MRTGKIISLLWITAAVILGACSVSLLPRQAVDAFQSTAVPQGQSLEEKILLQSTTPPVMANTPETTAPTETTVPPETTVPVDTEPMEEEPMDSKGVEQEAEAFSQNEAAVPVASTEAPGILVKEGGGAEIDYSNAAQGYVMVRHAQDPGARLKVQVKGPSTTYTYNLTPGQWTAFPLSDHTGQYQISVYINVVDSKYAVLLSLTTNVALADEFAPFLYPNQYVNFGAAPNTVAMAASLTAGMTAPLDKVASVYHYVVGNLTYDHELAATVTSGYLPDLDAVLAKGSGICFDYAALMTGMLRSQGVPTKLVIGYAGDVYHAWINVWSESEGWVDGVIHFDGFSWKLMDPTFASSGGSDLMGFISNSANYTAKYIY